MSNEALHHRLVTIPNGKKASDIVFERHDMVLLFEAKKANPNGDPDAENMPRIQPNTLKGLVTDVCLKRKIRNFFSLYKTDGNQIGKNAAESGYDIFIKENAILEQLMKATPIEALAKKIFVEKYETNEIVEGSSELDNFIKGNDKYRYDASSKTLTITGAMTDDERKTLIDSLKENATKKVIEKLFETTQHNKIIENCWDTKKANRRKSTKGKSKTGNSGQPSDTSTTDTVDDKQQKDEFNPSEERKQESYRDALCQSYFDLRTFGGVLSTVGPLKGSFYGQVRGPIQFSFAESLDKVLQLDATITRCCSTSKKEKEKEEEQSKKQSDSEEKTGGNRTMGRKYNIDYGLYRTHIYFSPAFAAKTGFTYADLDNFLFAITHMFTDDTSANRSGMRVVGFVDFQHSRALGNAPAHKLFEKVKVEKMDKNKEFPESIEDYWGEAPEGKVADFEKVAAKKIIWEIPRKNNV